MPSRSLRLSQQKPERRLFPRASMRKCVRGPEHGVWNDTPAKPSNNVKKDPRRFVRVLSYSLLNNFMGNNLYNNITLRKRVHSRGSPDDARLPRQSRPRCAHPLSKPSEDVGIFLARDTLDVRRQLPVDGITVDVFKELQLPRVTGGSLVLSPLSLFVLPGDVSAKFTRDENIDPPRSSTCPARRHHSRPIGYPAPWKPTASCSPIHPVARSA
jgi:hypothetical protein